MRRWVALPLLLTATALEAVETPRIELEPETRRWALTALPPILTDEAVKTSLASGLTSTFVVQARCRDRHGARLTGGARVEVRYELWDEVFQAASLGIDGRVERRTLTSFEELTSWWRSLRLAIFAPPPEVADTAKVRLTIDVLPFSNAERDDAQSWFSDSLDDAGASSSEALERTADDPPDRLARIFHLLMATSIQRRALTTYRFTLDPPSSES